MAILIGSSAIKLHFPDFKRIPKDLDIATQIKMVNNNPNIEYLENPILFEYIDSSWKAITINNHNYRVLPKDLLYTLKMSHLFWDLNWEKHEWDASFLRSKGCILNKELFYKLYNYWEIVHGKNKRSDLKMSSEKFFNNALKFPVEHDNLHELLIKHPYFHRKTPTYNLILKDGEEVDVCMNKFNALEEIDKFNVVFEEIACMGTERFPRNMFYKAIFCKMLKKFIISHAKIEEAIWILENYPFLVTNIPFDFKEYLWEQINNKLCN